MDLKITAKEGIEQIKKLLFGDEVVAPVEVAPVAMELVEYKLIDGTPVMIDKLAEGGQVLVADAPAPDGDHTLEDGTVITTLGGLIVALKTKEIEVEVEPLDAGKQKEYMTKSDFEGFAKEVLSKFSAQTKATEKTVEVLETMLKFEVEKPLKQTVDFDSMTPLQKYRASKNA